LTGLPDYEYTPLADPDADARIVELLPGKFDDDVKVRIHHVTLKHPDRPGDWREELKEVRNKLPEGWEVFKTVGRNHVVRLFVLRLMRAPRLLIAATSSEI
jgi:hypothetical protein